MKAIQIVTITGLLFLALQCSNDPARHSQKLDKALSGLNRLNVTEREEFAVLNLITDSADLRFPVYSLAGERLTQAQIREKKMNVTVECYGESLTDLKAVVYRDLTKAELDAWINVIRAKSKLENQALKSWVGRQAPAFTATDVNGNQVDLARLAGKVVVLNFWFIGCFACEEEMPELNRIAAEYKDRDVVFVALNFDPVAETKTFLRRTRFDYQIVAAAQPIFDNFGVRPCPTNMVIDRSGQVVFADSGYKPYEDLSYKQITGAINRVLQQ